MPINAPRGIEGFQIPLTVSRCPSVTRAPRNVIVQLHHTVVEAFHGVEVQRRVTVTPRDQWNAISDEHWNHTDDELVDRLLVEKGGDELPAAHQPDILARMLSKAADEGPDRT